MFLFGSSKNIELTDQELLVKYKATGKGDYLGELFKRYSHLVFGVCMNYLKIEEEARDASMLIFEKLFEDVKKHEIENFGGWLRRVSANYCLMEIRSRKSFEKRKDHFHADETNIVEMNPFVHQDKELEEQRLNRLAFCMEKLNEDQLKCVRLFFLEEKCYREIALETKYELKKVKSNIQNGKRNLKICMSEA